MPYNATLNALSNRAILCLSTLSVVLIVRSVHQVLLVHSVHSVHFSISGVVLRLIPELARGLSWAPGLMGGCPLSIIWPRLQCSSQVGGEGAASRVGGSTSLAPPAEALL